MKTGKGSEGILRQGLIVISLVIVFFTIITLTGVGVEEIQAEKAFSEYIKKFNNLRGIDISNDFSKLMLTREGEEFKIISLWDIYEKDEPEFILEKEFGKYERVYSFSPDFTIYAHLNSGYCYIRQTEDDNLINKIILPDNYKLLGYDSIITNNKKDAFTINNKNNLIAIVKNRGDTNSLLFIYDIQSGKKIIEERIPGLYQFADLAGFSFDDKYLIVSKSADRGIYDVYSMEEGSFVYKIESVTEPFIKQKDLLITNNPYDNSDVKIIDLAKGEVKSSLKMDSGDVFGLYPDMYTEYTGTGRSKLDDSFHTYFNETISGGNKIFNRKKYYIGDKIKARFYDYNKERWIIVGEENIHYIPANTGESNKIAEDYLEGMEMMEYGFKEGFKKVKKALVSENIIGLTQNYGKFLNPDYDLTLKQRAELVLAEYNSLMAGESRALIGISTELNMSPMGNKIKSIRDYSDLNKFPEIKEGAIITAVNGKAIIPDKDLTDYYSHLEPGESITLTINQDGINKDYDIKLAGNMIDNYNTMFAHNKLFEYGLLAARAGYPQFTLQAAEQIRNLELIYPNDLFWDLINKESILLEAVGIAARDGSEAGYSYMMDNDGIIYDDEDRNYLLDSYLNDYPEYFAPLLVDRKKMSYFTKIAENKIPSVHMWEPEKVDFVDLEGNEIAGVDGRMGDSTADGAAGKNNSGESDDLNSGDDNSSDSGAAGIVLD